MPTNREIGVAALIESRGCRERIRLGLRGHANVLFAEAGVELLGIVESAVVDVAIVEPWARGSPSTEETIRRMRHRFGRLPILVYVDCSPDSVRRILGLTKAGADNVILRHI